MEKQGLKSGYLIAHKYIQRAVAKAFNLNIDATSITLLLNDKKGDYQTAFGNMLFNKFKATNEEIKKFEKMMEIIMVDTAPKEDEVLFGVRGELMTYLRASLVNTTNTDRTYFDGLLSGNWKTNVVGILNMKY